MSAVVVHEDGRLLRSGVEQVRRTLAEIEALPVTEAASRARAAESSPWRSPSPVYQPGAERGFGPSL